jgi:hypothetical protein
MLLAVLAVWYYMGREERHAREFIEMMTPGQIASALFQSDELPDCIPLPVEGILDLRLPHFEFMWRPDRSLTAYDYDSVRVYGLLYPSDSDIDEYTGQLRELAGIIAAPASAEGTQLLRDSEFVKKYEDALNEFSRVYEEMSAGDAVLVELDLKKHSDLLEASKARMRKQASELENSATRLLERYRTGESGPPAEQVIAENAALVKSVLRTDSMKRGVFNLQIIEHRSSMQSSYKQSGSLRPRVRLVRTVREVTE